MSAVSDPEGDRNRSLMRGMEILRAFRPGSDLHGNGELAERTGLSRSTVSRLAQTLVACGMLERDRRGRAYRLAAPVLSLAHAMRTGSPVLAAAQPLIRKEAERLKINEDSRSRIETRWFISSRCDTADAWHGETSLRASAYRWN